jgi:hypothetical protein
MRRTHDPTTIKRPTMRMPFQISSSFKALEVSPRIGHIHVVVDDAPWHWADASGEQLIIVGLPPGPHKVEITLANANHQPLDRASVSFIIPEAPAQSH